jgi:CPA2 family monovalent cation:H+ antiporter-2
VPHNVALIATIAAGLGLALILGFVAVRIGIPALVGYLVAGILIGPYTPGFIADVSLSQQLAEIGVMLLMFGVGMHFSLEDLLSVRRIALPGAIAQIAVATFLGFLVSRSWGWSPEAGLVFGLALSVASTVVLLRALEDLGLLESLNGRIAVGWLVVEDLAMVLTLVLLPPLAAALEPSASQATPAGSIWVTVGLTLAKISLFLAIMLIAGRRIFPALLAQVARTGSRELFTLCVIAVALSTAYVAAELFGVSFALGAFFAGVVVGGSDLSHRAARESLPLRDAFAVLFFVSVGMLFDPAILLRQPMQVAAVVAIILIGKTAAAFGLVLLFRYPLNTALTVSASLAQIGEFSFILAGLGVSLNLLPEDGRSLVLAGALLSISLNPLLFRAIAPAQVWIRARSSLARALERSDDPLAELPATVDPAKLTGNVLIVGYGRVGRRIGKALLDAGVTIVVAEQDREAVEDLRERQIPAVSGDATEPAVLIQAHVARATVLVIAIPDPFAARRMVDVARKLNPTIKVVARTHTEADSELLDQAGVDRVFMGEHELAIGMANHILEQLPHATHRAGR